jgi:hypothetical protein
VCDIDDRRFRRNVENDAFDGAHEMIVGAKVGSERNYRTTRQNYPRWKTKSSVQRN